jgi:hypothetical protein
LSGGSYAKTNLVLVHTYVCGPMATTFHGRAKYFLTFIDDFFGKTFLYTKKIKFGVLDKLRLK